MLEGIEIGEAINTIRVFLLARNIDDKIEFIRTHSFLLTDDALLVFDHLRDSSLKRGDADFAETLRHHRVMVERVRQVGSAQAARELHSLTVLESVQEFIGCYSWMDSYIYLGEHPELKTEEALDILGVLGMQAHDEGDAQAEKIAAAHYNLLRRVGQIGAEAAFSEVGGEDFRAALRRRRSR
jgi:hypothetical protein